MIDTENRSILKNEPLEDNVHYAFLREKGLKHIEKLAADLWTDYNVHDPGVTQMEMLCYTLTELGYKADYPVKDILAEDSVWPNEAFTDFYSARHILPCAPVTIEDYRKVLIDVPGIKNGWLKIVDPILPAIHLDCKKEHEMFNLNAQAWKKLQKALPLFTFIKLKKMAKAGFVDEKDFRRFLTKALNPLEQSQYTDFITKTALSFTSNLTYKKKFLLNEKVLDSIEPPLPQSVENKLKGLFGKAYYSKESFGVALATVLSPLEIRKYRSILQTYAMVYLTLPVQGVYDITLEFEPDPLLGNLNIFYEKGEIGTEGHGFDIEIHIQPLWDQYLKNNPQMESITSIEFITPIDYDLKRKVYRTTLKMESDNGTVILFPVTLLSNGEKSKSNRLKIEAYLDNNRENFFTSLEKKIKQAIAITRKVRIQLHKQRNLCEDFGEIKGIETEEVAICADIQVSSEANIEEVLAEIYYLLKKELSPCPLFYTIPEMKEKGFSADETFKGPILNHGFLDHEEIEKSDLKTHVYGSNIINIIMDVPGVTAVKSLLISNFFNGEALNSGEQWCLPITPGRATKLYITKSRVTFFKDLIPYHANKEEVLEKIVHRHTLDRERRLAPRDYDIEIPKGESQGIQDYHSIQNGFPLVYGVGQAGIEGTATDLRKAQAKQLKAFMLLFDKLFANFFAQLAQVRDLFSLNPHIKKTYFRRHLLGVDPTYKLTLSIFESLKAVKDIQPILPKIKPLIELPRFSFKAFDAELKTILNAIDYNNFGTIIIVHCKMDPLANAEVPHLAPLLERFATPIYKIDKINLDKPSTYEKEWEAFVNLEKEKDIQGLPERDELLEDKQTYEDRKNRILDHLMARFAEQFTDYVLLQMTLSGKKAPAQLIEDKQKFLQDYPRISKERGLGLDYTLPEGLLSQNNTSGLERRGARLVGIQDFYFRRLFDNDLKYIKIYQEKDLDNINEYRFRIQSKGNVLLSSSKNYLQKALCLEQARKTVQLAADTKNYLLKQTKNGRYYFNLGDEEGEIIARRIEYFDSEKEREQAIEEIQAISESCEGLHLVEHILLRPREVGNPLMTVCVPEDCNTCPGLIDPYSFRASIILPGWLSRFAQMDYRRYLEKTMRLEAPAHVHLKICWVSRKDMERFENDYLPWLAEHAKVDPDPETLSTRTYHLIRTLENIHNIYPETRLYSCKEELDSLLLNNSVLGEN